MDAEGGHPLQQADSAGHGYLKIWLLQSIPKTCIEQLDFSRFRVLHLS
jgi:hypothetical protein